MKVRATAVAAERANAIGSVELECTPHGLSVAYLGVGAFSEGYAPGALTMGTRITVPWAKVQEARVEGDQLFFAFDPELTPHHRMVLTAFSTGDYRKLAAVMIEMGGAGGDKLEMEAFVKDLADTYSPLLKLSFGEVNYADFLPGIQRVATRHRVKMPKEFILITKQLLYFDRYAKALAPKLNVFTDPRLIFSMMADIQKVRASRPQPAAQA